MIEITGLWKNVDKNGITYLSGNLGNSKIMIMKNTFKEKENQPDYRLYITERKKKSDNINDIGNEENKDTEENIEDDMPF